MEEAPWLGIVGGMGTSAGLLFEQLLFQACNDRGVKGDQNYPQWTYINASRVPDRTRAIFGEGPSCLPALIDAVSRLQAAGAEVIVVACNTAHYFYEQVYRQIALPWIHLQRETARHMLELDIERAGILATAGTIRSQLYQQTLRDYGIDAVAPEVNSRLQEKVTNAIYHPRFGIKFTGADISAEAAQWLREAIDELGAPQIVAGCTELSVAFANMDLPVDYIDPLVIATDVFFALADGRRDLASLITPDGARPGTSRARPAATAQPTP